MKKCKKCQGRIPSTIVIEGKRRNLSKRKFCLDCSKFGSHNTKPIDPDSIKVSRNYSTFTDEQKIRNQLSVWKKGINRKQMLVDMKGGKCEKCGYNKCLRALTFHHRESDKKSFTLDTRCMRGTKWEKIVKEAEKCELLCFNCHMEHHEEEDDANGLYKQEINRRGGIRTHDLSVMSGLL